MVRLLIRSNRGISLTEEVTTFYEYAENILKLMHDAKSAINKKKCRENLTIGEIDGVFVNRLFDKERFESVYSFLGNVVLLSHLVVKSS